MSDKQQVISRAEAEHVAELARLRFDEAEMQHCLTQLDAILDDMRKLQAIETSGVPPTSHILPLTNVFREDRPGQTLPLEQVLANAPDTEDNCFKVPRII